MTGKMVCWCDVPFSSACFLIDGLMEMDAVVGEEEISWVSSTLRVLQVMEHGFDWLGELGYGDAKIKLQRNPLQVVERVNDTSSSIQSSLHSKL